MSKWLTILGVMVLVAMPVHAFAAEPDGATDEP